MIHNPFPKTYSPGIIYAASSPEFVGVMPVRTEITVLEGDDVNLLRRAIYSLLNSLSDEEIEAIYNESFDHATVASVLEL